MPIASHPFNYDKQGLSAKFSALSRCTNFQQGVCIATNKNTYIEDPFTSGIELLKKGEHERPEKPLVFLACYSLLIPLSDGI